MVWLPDGVKFLTDSMNVTDTRIGGRTPHDDIGHACIASCGKNYIA